MCLALSAIASIQLLCVLTMQHLASVSPTESLQILLMGTVWQCFPRSNYWSSLCKAEQNGDRETALMSPLIVMLQE